MATSDDYKLEWNAFTITSIVMLIIGIVLQIISPFLKNLMLHTVFMILALATFLAAYVLMSFQAMRVKSPKVPEISVPNPNKPTPALVGS